MNAATESIISLEHTTSFSVFPSADVLVIADWGVSGSISPFRMFLNIGILPMSMQFGSVAQGSGG